MISLICCYCSVTKFVSDSATTWTAARQASLSFTISQSLLRLLSIEPLMLSNHLILSLKNGILKKKDTNDFIYKTEIDSQTSKTYGYQGTGGGVN